MSFSGAFRRAAPLLAPAKKAGVAVHLVKFWKALPRDGEIVRTLSPNEQNVVTPWLKTFPKKVMVRAPYYIYNLGITFVLVYIGYWWPVTMEARSAYSHRF